MPIQGSLRDLSVLETLQLIGTQRKSVTLKLQEGGARIDLHFQDGLLVAIESVEPGRREPLIDTMVALGHISPAEALPLIEQVRDARRNAWQALRSVSRIERETCEAVYRAVTEATLDRVLLWDRGHFSMHPLAAVERVFDPGISMDSLLLDAMRRLDELAAWKQGEIPPTLVPCIPGGGELVITSDPLRRAVSKQTDGRRTIQEIVDATGLGEYDVYETITTGILEGWLQILDRPAQEKPVQSGAREVLRRSPVIMGLVAILVVVAMSSWIDRRLAVDRGLWDQARAQWEEGDLRRLIEVYRFRNGAYPSDLASLQTEGLPVADATVQRWFYRVDGTSYRLTPH